MVLVGLCFTSAVTLIEEEEKIDHKSDNWYHSLSVCESITAVPLLRLQVCSYVSEIVFQA